jgi:acyl-coenzyme A thioesterase PaaI-like protein
MTTVDLKLNYLAALTRGRMVGNGRCLRAGGTLYLSEASIRNQEGEPMNAVLPVKFLD